MTDEQVFEHLKQVLASNGLDYNDPEVFNFFNNLLPKRAHYASDETGKVTKFKTSRHIKPTLKKVLPSDFANSGYFDDAQENTILEWFMYRNASSNPLVWDNIGKDSNSIKQSFVSRRSMAGPAEIDAEGNLFNGEDGNHRLLTLKINHFIERQKAKTEQEKAEVDKKYEMEIEVALPFNVKLCDLLSNVYYNLLESYKEDSLIPRYAVEYRKQSYSNYYECERIVDYNPETKIFTYNFNDVNFSGTEQELIEFLQTAEIHNMPLMKWEAEGVSYISCYNHIWKSNNKEYIEKLYPRIEQAYLDGKIEKHTFLEIKNVDTQTYEVRFPSMYEEDELVANQIAKYLQSIIKSGSSPVLFNKLINYNEQGFLEAITKNGFFKDFNLGEIRYENLTKEEELALAELFKGFEQRIEEVKDNTILCE